MTVIIIGAGIAGLTAARNLSRACIPTIILEAQDRIGGRVYTKNGLDLGASWLHDIEHNALFPVAQALKLRLAYDLKCFFYSEGELVSPYVVDEAMQLISQIAEADSSMSLRDYALKVTKGSPRAADLQRIMQALEHWTGMSWRDMSAPSAEMHPSSPDAFNLSGNSRLVEWIDGEIDRDYVTLRLSAPVKKISGEYTIELESGEKLDADAVICTIPVGALNSELFDLELPSELKSSIDESVMACLGKVFMRFKTRWWDNVPDRMEVFSRRDAILSDSNSAEPGDQPVFFTNVHKFTGENVLVALVATPLTERVEAHPDKAFSLLKPALEQIRANPGVPVEEPIEVRVTDWTQNRFFRGSYSGIKVGQDEEATYGPFFTGYKGLRFAGEHATDDSVGTMQAAYMTGEREAAKVVDLLAKGK